MSERYVRVGYTQIVDWAPPRGAGAVISMHAEDGTILWMHLDRETWETLRAAGDDAIAIGLGDAPPRSASDPDRKAVVPLPWPWRTGDGETP